MNKQQEIQQLEILKRFNTLFFNSLSDQIIRDLICYFSSKIVNAESVSLLLYSSLKDKLVCKGRYISLQNAKFEENNIYSRLMEKIHYYDFVYFEKDNNPLINVEDSYRNFKEYFQVDNLSSLIYKKVFSDYDNWKPTFEEYRKILNEEKYSIDKESISGKSFIKFLTTNDEILLDQTSEVDFSKRLCESLLKNKLNIEMLEFDIYIGLPLKFNNRVFGLIRFLFSSNKIVSQSLEALKNDILYQKLLLISQIISINYLNLYYYEGFKKIAFNSLSTQLNNIGNLTDYLKFYANELGKLVNARGVAFINNKDKNVAPIFSIGFEGDKALEDFIYWLSFSSFFNKTIGTSIAVNIEFRKKHVEVKEYDINIKTNSIIQVNSSAKKSTDFPIPPKNINIVYVKLPLIPEIKAVFVNLQSRPFDRHDIEMIFSVLKRIELEIDQQNQTDRILLFKMKEVILNVAHQVISPLTALNYHCANLISGIVPESKIEQRLNYIAILARIASRHTRAFEQLLKLDEGNIKLDKKKVHNINLYLISKAIDFQPQAQEKGIKIHVEKNVDDINLYIDQKIFDHVMFVLLDNAVKYSFPKDSKDFVRLKKYNKLITSPNEITINTEVAGGQFSIEISNFGIEIPESEKESIFQRNFRSFKAKQKVLNGSGIGLYIAKEIVELHEGNIILCTIPNNPNFIKFQILLPHG